MTMLDHRSDVASPAAHKVLAPDATGAKIIDLVIVSGTVPEQRANLMLDVNGRHKQAEGVSKKGPHDAIALAIHKILGREAALLTFKARSQEPGTDAEGTVTIRVMINGKEVRSTAKNTDPNLAFARAYLGVFNRK